jgi:uncharacterized protein YjbJ (UPF0337 family)
MVTRRGEAKMNADILKGKWKEIKGEVKVKWGKLTDDDLTQIEGHEEKLLGFLQKRYEYSKDQAEREYNEFVGRYGKSPK